MRAVADSYTGYERDFMKQTMLEHESLFKNQVHELHRLYKIQRNLVDEVKGKNLNEDMNVSDHTSETASKRQIPGFLLENSTYGEGSSSSRACNGRLQNGLSSKDGDVLEVRPVKVKRKMIDLRLPADEYLDMDETGDIDEITICPPYKQSKSGTRDASYQSNSSGSCLDVKNLNGFVDLNEPLKWPDSEPVTLSRDMYSHYGRNNGDIQGQWLEKNRSQNGWMFLEAGHDKSTQRDDLHLPFHYAQVLPNNAFQPQSYPATDYLEVRSKNPQVSYGNYMESNVESNAPRLHNGYHPNFVRPWSHWSSSWENPRSSSHQKSYPVQTNPCMNFVTQPRTDSSFEMRSHVSNGLYQGYSSGLKEAALNFPSAAFKPIYSSSEVVKHQSFENFRGPIKQEYSAGLPWLKPKPLYKNKTSNGFLDLNASTNQFIDEIGTGDGLNSVSHQKGLRSASCSNNANMGRVEMINPQSSRKIIHSTCKEKHKEVDHLVKRDLDINKPCDASVSVDQHVAKANSRHYIDLNTCASEDDEDSASQSSLRVKTKAKTWIDLEAPAPLESEDEGGEMKGQDGNSMSELIKVAAQAIVAISLSFQQRHPDDAASSSTDAAAKGSLSWFVGIITSQGEGYLEEDSSFEAMTLKLPNMKEEDYMPKPLVPDNLIFEGTTLNRPRRGQARRGRPKRDFQRDVLPGLASLSRHEVTEDIQRFGGLMKTRECTGNSGVAARRNSKRRRQVTNTSQAPVSISMVQPMNESVSVVGVGLEYSKLTGWGKATRRPRRQRCPPSNVILT